MPRTTYTVEGMTCGHCVSAVTAELTKLEGVTDVDVDLDNRAVQVTSDGPLDERAVRESVEEAGFELVARIS